MKYIEEYDKELKDLLLLKKFSAGKILKSNSKKYLYNYVMNCTRNVSQSCNLITRMFFTINHKNEIVKCIQCGNELKNQNIKFGTNCEFRQAFVKFCSPHCECINDEIIQKQNQTNIKKYGCKWTFQSQNNKEKSRNTMFKKYGVYFSQQNKQIKEKQLATMKQIYGVSCVSQIDSYKKSFIFKKRQTIYRKFLLNEYCIPLFSEEEYIKNGDSIEYKWKCKKCNNEFYSCRNESWFKQGKVKSYARCENCYPYTLNSGYSNYEIELFNFLNNFSNKYKVISRQYENRNTIDNFELDIIVKNLSENRKLAIEFDGLYWHSEESGKNKNYHLNKTQLCKDKNIQLIHIFENEWIYKKDIVKSRLKNLLGVYDKTIFARKCQIKEITNKDSRDFQEVNHLQGVVNAKVNIGLYHNNELISLMTFGKCRFDKKHEWEMLRFCNKLGYHIPGGASKLLKYFEKTYKPKSLVSYADRRWSQGKLYEKLGFKLDHISRPDYWYFKNGDYRLLSRINFQKHKLKNILKDFDENKTEVQNMKDNGYNRIFDCGNLVFEKIIVNCKF